MVSLDSLMPFLEKASYVISQMPLPYILASMLLAFIIVYTLANKAVSLVLMGAAQFALYHNTKEQLGVLVATVPGADKLVNQTITSSEAFHPLIYMDKVLKVASIVPGGLEHHKLIYPILLSFLLLWVYVIYTLMGKTRRDKPRQIVPILALGIVFGMLAGGEGVWKYLSVNKFMGVGYNWMFLFTVILYTAFVFKKDKRRYG